MDQIKRFIITHKTILFLVLIGIVTLVSHFYLLPQNLHFYADEANMSQIIRNIAIKHIFPTEGPPTSVGGASLYHGAFYYYLYFIPGFISHFNPLGYGIFTALLSSTSVFLLFYCVKDAFANEILSYLTAGIYAISFNVALYGRAEWNPNLIPFFVVLSLFALIRLIKINEWYSILFFFCIGAITQLHITGYIFIPIILVLVAYIKKYIHTWYIWCFCIFGFLTPIFPTLIHEIRHHFSILKAIIALFAHPSHMSIIAHLHTGFNTISFLFGQVIGLDGALMVIVFLSAICMLGWYVYTKSTEMTSLVSLYMLLILVFSFCMYAFYPGIVYIHFGEQLFALAPFCMALFLSVFFARKELLFVVGAILFMILDVNIKLFNDQIIHGDRPFQTESMICSHIKQTGASQAEIVWRGQINPGFMSYICDNDYGIKIATSPVFYVTTDYPLTQESVSP